PAAGADSDESDTGEGQACADPERSGQICAKKCDRDQPHEHRARTEEERDGRGVSELEAVDEAELVHEDHRRCDADVDPVVPRYPERAVTPPRVDPEDGDGDEVPNGRVGERKPAV